MSLEDLQREVLNEIVKLNETEAGARTGPTLTGEKALCITKEELIRKVLENSHGEAYLEVLDAESQLLVRQGLFRGYIEGDEIMFDIPNWDQFISAVNCFYVACYAPESKDPLD